MRRKNSCVLLAFIIIVALAAIMNGGTGDRDNPPVSDNPPPNDGGREQPRDIPEDEFYKLIGEGKLDAYIHLYGAVKYIYNGDNGDGLDEIFRNTVNSVDEAIYELNNVKTILGLSDPEAELSGEDRSDSFERVYRLDQSYKGIPVYGGGINVLVSHEGKITDLVSSYVKIRGDFNVTPSITSGDAEEIARRAAEAELAREGRNPGEFGIITTSRLVVYTSDEHELNPLLTWRVSAYVTDGVILDTDFFVDQGGQIIQEITNIYD